MGADKIDHTIYRELWNDIEQIVKFAYADYDVRYDGPEQAVCISADGFSIKYRCIDTLLHSVGRRLAGYVEI